MSLPDIAVVVLTYRRQEMLFNTLQSLMSQVTKDEFTFEIYVIDNDATQSSGEVVNNFAANSRIKINYYCEPLKNIARARNRALKVIREQYLAFIHDDEFASEEWLYYLYHKITEMHTVAVYGPIITKYWEDTPQWVIEAGHLQRIDKPTRKGSIMKTGGNSFWDMSIIRKEGIFFDENFGLTAGEDTVFIITLEKRGYKSAFSEKAIVYERPTKDRHLFSYFVKKALREGNVNMRIHLSGLKKYSFIYMYVLRLSAFFQLIILTPFFPFMKKRRTYYMCLRRTIQIGGMISAVFGVKLQHYRNKL